LEGNGSLREIVLDPALDDQKIGFDDQTSFTGDSNEKARHAKNKRKLIRKMLQDGMIARFCA
jgi:hypothetical protein